MAGKPKDLAGRKFGKLTAIEFVGSNKRRIALWKCRCECGNIVIKDSNSLQRLLVKSCGCLIKEVNTISNKKPKHLTHGYYNTKIYKVYAGMKDRCLNKKSKDYKNYGDRGITICNEWRNDFLAFKDWAENNGYKENLSIDRINVNGNYEPSNCRWATAEEQQNNKRNNNLLENNGVIKTIAEWSIEIGINKQTLYSRIKNGWSAEETLYTPLNKRRNAV